MFLKQKKTANKIIGFIMAMRLVKFANRWLNLTMALESICPLAGKI
jgi:hypothetical protein